MHGLIAPGVFDLVGRIGALHSVSAVWSTYLQAARYVGLPYGIAIFTGSRALTDRLIATTMPEGWFGHYERCGYAAVNPLAQRTQSAAHPFAWSAHEWQGGSNPLLRGWRDDNVSAGMPGGLGVPDRSGEGRAIVLGGPNTDLHPNDRRTLHFAGMAALHRMQELTANTVFTPVLSARERECLTWVAAGKSDWEIGGILSLSNKTVNMYIERAKHKLHATTRIQAVVQALQTGQIAV